MIVYYDFYDNEGRHTGSYISDDTLEETMKDLHLVTIEYNGVVYDRINMEQGRGGWKATCKSCGYKLANPAELDGTFGGLCSTCIAYGPLL